MARTINASVFFFFVAFYKVRNEKHKTKYKLKCENAVEAEQAKKKNEQHFPA